MRALVTGCLVLSLAACDERERPPPPPRHDAGPITPRDAGVAPSRDAGSPPTIDGVLEEWEWMGAEDARSEHPSDAEGSALRRLVARVRDGALYVGVAGSLTPGDAIVLYVDHSLGQPGGVDDLRTLSDRDGPLDAAIASAEGTPTGFRADFAWGTTVMPHGSVGLDEAAGWRRLADAAAFTSIDAADAPTVCTASACETSIPLATLGGTRPRTLALFARLVRAGGGWANQTLPMDMPDMPGRVSALYTLEDGAAIPDAGVPDAGRADGGGPGGVVIDGQLAAGEWDGASRYDQSIVAIAPFTGARAETLLVERTASSLRFAIVGALGAGHAFVVYIDDDVGGPDGLASPTPLDDLASPLHVALSKALLTPPDLRLDAAWGTLDMDRVAGPSDGRMGFRSLDDPTRFTVLPGASACGPEVCEAEIALADLGVRAGAEIGLFVRLVSASSEAFSNQTLPADDAFSPEVVSVYVTLRP